MIDRIFLIGPGGAGKTTVGKILAPLIGYIIIDLDSEFCNRIANIREFIKSHGYESYLEQNSALLNKLLVEQAGQKTLFVLSSGFLSTNIRQDILLSNQRRVHERGLTVMIMPSKDYNQSLECIIERQLNRGFSLVREKEVEKFSQRFADYLEMGDLKIFSMEKAECLAIRIAGKLTLLNI